MRTYLWLALSAITIGAIARVVLALFAKEPDLYLSMDRLNREIRAQQWEHVDEASDLCMARVRRRMTLGPACTEAPLYNGNARRLHLVRQAKRA